MQKILRRDLDCDRLVVRWNREAGNYEVGEVLRGDRSIHWFHAVVDENNEYRQLDKRLVAELKEKDKKNFGRVTIDEFRRAARDRKQKRDEKWSEMVRYKARHELRRRFVKWADENM